jgi:hypothetical protein
VVTTPRRLVFLTALATAIGAFVPSAALAAVPSNTADAGVYMVSGPVVNDVVIHSGNAWIGGEFSQVENQNGSAVASASGLTVFGPSGTLLGPIHGNLPNFGGNETIFDLSLGPNGILYAAGSFSYTQGGKTFKNLVGINPVTGGIAAAFNASGLKSVLATSDGVYGGGKRLWRFGLNGGSSQGSFHSMTAIINPDLRGHAVTAAFREIVEVGDNTLIVVGAFDWIDAQTESNKKKVAVKVNATTGQPDLGSGSWSLDCNCVNWVGASFGLAIDVDGGIAYIAAGGNDWAGAFRVSDGGRVWQTDSNGSVQDIAVADAATVIVGGHWTYIEDDGAGDPAAGECPPRNASNPDPCWVQPRLAALDRQNGLADKSWTPSPCCRYRGVWATTIQGSIVHIGGEFTRLDGESGPEHFYGRFS